MNAIENGRNGRHGVLAACLVGCCWVSACGNDASSNGTPPQASASAQLSADCKGRGVKLKHLQLDTDDGFGLTVASAEPETPFVGDNAWSLALTQDEVPLLGIAPSLEAIPFMPDHGHGTAVPVDIIEQTPGQYLFAPVNLRMPGYWEVTLTLTGDAGSRQLMIPVCVQ